MKQNLRASFKPFGITNQQYNVLRILRGQHPKTVHPGYIKEVMIEPSPDLTRLIDRLVEKQLVQRQVCEENRRQIDLSITPAGLELLERIDPKMEEQMLAFSSRITEEEAAKLSDILDKIRG